MSRGRDSFVFAFVLSGISVSLWSQPQPVTDLYARPTATDTIALDWTAVAGADSYLIQRSTLSFEYQATVTGDVGQGFGYSVQIVTEAKTIAHPENPLSVTNEDLFKADEKFATLCANANAGFMLVSARFDVTGQLGNAHFEELRKDLNALGGCYQVKLRAEPITELQLIKGEKNSISGNMIIETEKRITVTGSSRTYANETTTIPVSGLRIVSLEQTFPQNTAVILSIDGANVFARTTQQNIQSVSRSFRDVGFNVVREIDLTMLIPPVAPDPLRGGTPAPMKGFVYQVTQPDPRIEFVQDGPNKEKLRFFAIPGLDPAAFTDFTYTATITGDAGQTFTDTILVASFSVRTVNFIKSENRSSDSEERHTFIMCADPDKVLVGAFLSDINKEGGGGTHVEHRREMFQRGGCYEVELVAFPVFFLGRSEINANMVIVQEKEEWVTVNGRVFRGENLSVSFPGIRLVFAHSLFDFLGFSATGNSAVFMKSDEPDPAPVVTVEGNNTITRPSGGGKAVYFTNMPSMQSFSNSASTTAFSEFQNVDLAAIRSPTFPDFTLRDFNYGVSVGDPNVDFFLTGANNREFRFRTLAGGKFILTTSPPAFDKGTALGPLEDGRVYHYGVFSRAANAVQKLPAVAATKAIAAPLQIPNEQMAQSQNLFCGTVQPNFDDPFYINPSSNSSIQNLEVRFNKNRPIRGKARILLDPNFIVREMAANDVIDNFDNRSAAGWGGFGDSDFVTNVSTGNFMLRLSTTAFSGRLVRTDSFGAGVEGEGSVSVLMKASRGFGGIYLESTDTSVPGPGGVAASLGIGEESPGWHHLEIRFQGGVAKSYLDGRFVAEVTIPKFSGRAGLFAQGRSATILEPAPSNPIVFFDDFQAFRTRSQISWDGRDANSQLVFDPAVSARRNLIFVLQAFDVFGSTITIQRDLQWETGAPVIGTDHRAKPHLVNSQLQKRILYPFTSDSVVRLVSGDLFLRRISGGETSVSLSAQGLSVNDSSSLLRLTLPSNITDGQWRLGAFPNSTFFYNRGCIQSNSIVPPFESQPFSVFVDSFVSVDSRHPALVPETGETFHDANSFTAPFVLRFKTFRRADRGLHVNLKIRDSAGSIIHDNTITLSSVTVDTISSSSMTWSGVAGSTVALFRYSLEAIEWHSAGGFDFLVTGLNVLQEGTLVQYPNAGTQLAAAGDLSRAQLIFPSSLNMTIAQSTGVPTGLSLVGAKFAGTSFAPLRTSAFFDVNPDGTVFSPLVAVLRIKPSPKSGDDPSQMSIFRYDTATNIWEPLPTTFDLTSGELIATTEKASLFAAFHFRGKETSPPISTLATGEPKFIGPDQRLFVASKTSLRIEAGDASGIEKSLFRVRKESLPPLETFSQPFTIAGEDGLRFVDFLSIDRLGNREAQKTQVIALDNTAPDADLIADDPGLAFSSGTVLYVTSRTPLKINSVDPLVNGVASGGAGGSFKDRTAGGSFAVTGGTFSMVGNDGSRIIDFFGVDNLGNQGSIKSRLLALDNTAPEITVTPNRALFQESGAFYATSSDTFHVAVRDGLSGVKSISLSINSEPFQSIASGHALSLKQEGNFFITIRALDQVGNLSQKQQSIVIDNTPPDFSGVSTVKVDAEDPANLIVPLEAVEIANGSIRLTENALVPPNGFNIHWEADVLPDQNTEPGRFDKTLSRGTETLLGDSIYRINLDACPASTNPLQSFGLVVLILRPNATLPDRSYVLETRFKTSGSALGSVLVSGPGSFESLNTSAVEATLFGAAPVALAAGQFHTFQIKKQPGGATDLLVDGNLVSKRPPSASPDLLSNVVLAISCKGSGQPASAEIDYFRLTTEPTVVGTSATIETPFIDADFVSNFRQAGSLGQGTIAHAFSLDGAVFQPIEQLPKTVLPERKIKFRSILARDSILKQAPSLDAVFVDAERGIVVTPTLLEPLRQDQPLLIEFTSSERLASSPTVTVGGEPAFDGNKPPSLSWRFNFTLPANTAGPLPVVIEGVDLAGNKGRDQTARIGVGDFFPTRTSLSIGQPQSGVEPVFVTPVTPLEFRLEDDLNRIGDKLGTGVQSLHLALEGISSTTINNPDPMAAVFTATITLLGIADGIYDLRFFGKDRIGNTEQVKTKRIGLDSLPPGSAFSGSRNFFRENDTVYAATRDTFGFVATDAGSGVRETFFSINDAPLTRFTQAFSFSQEGKVKIQFRSVDNLGHEEPLQTIQLVLENTPPTFSEAARISVEAEDLSNAMQGLDLADGALRLKTDTVSFFPDDQWDIRYEGEVLPDNNSPAFMVDRSFIRPEAPIKEKIEDGVYRILFGTSPASGSGGQLSFSLPATLNDQQGFTSEWRIRMLPNAIMNMSLRSQNFNSFIRLFNNTVEVPVFEGGQFVRLATMEVSPNAFHTYRITSQGGSFSLFVDHQLFVMGQATALSQVLLGSVNSVAIRLSFDPGGGGIDVDYIRANTQKTQPPGINPVTQVTGKLEGSVETPFLVFSTVTKLDNFAAIQTLGEGEILHEFTTDEAAFLPVAQLANVNLTTRQIKFRSTLRRASLENASPSLNSIAFDVIARLVEANPAMIGPHSFGPSLITFTASERLSQAPNVTIDKGQAEDGNIPPSLSWTFRFRPPQDQSSGVFPIKIEGFDFAGNLGTDASGRITIDSLAPQSVLTIGEPKLETDPILVGPRTIFSFLSEDGLITIGDKKGAGVKSLEVFIDNALVKSFNNADFSAPLASSMSLLGVSGGAHILSFTAKDALENPESAQTVAIIVDDVPPVTVLVPSRNLFQENNTLYATTLDTFSLATQDAASGVRETLFRIEEGTQTQFTQPIRFEREGEFKLRFHSIDNFDNVEPEQTFTIVVDTTAPTFSGEAPVMVEAEDPRNTIRELALSNGSLVLPTTTFFGQPTENWTFRFEGDGLPMNNDPPFGLFRSPFMDPSIKESTEGGIYKILFEGQAQTFRAGGLRPQNLNLSSATGYTVEWQMRMSVNPAFMGSGAFVNFRIADHNVFFMRVFQSGLLEVSLPQSPFIERFFVGSMDTFHTFRVISQNGIFILFVDQQRIIEVASIAFGFGEMDLAFNYQAGVGGQAELGYWRVNNQGSFPPTTHPQLVFEGPTEGSVETPFIPLPEVSRINGFKAAQDLGEGEIIHEFTTDGTTFLPVTQLIQADVFARQIKFRSSLKRALAEKRSPSLDSISFGLKRLVQSNPSVLGPKITASTITFIVSERLTHTPSVTAAGLHAFDGNLPPSFLWNFKFNLDSNLAGGSYPIEITGADLAGNSGFDGTGRIIVDRLPPRTTMFFEPGFVAASAGDLRQSVLNTQGLSFPLEFAGMGTLFSLSSIDDLLQVDDSSGPGIALQRATLGDMAALAFVNPKPGKGMPFVSTFTLFGLPDGVYPLGFTAQDAVGVEESTITRTVVLDTLPPATALSAGRPLFRENNTIYAMSRDTFGFVAQDNLSGVRETLLSINGGSFAVFNPLMPLSFNSEGKFLIAFKSVDQLGNQEPENVLSIVIDNTPPNFSGTTGVRIEVEDADNIFSRALFQEINGSLVLGTLTADPGSGSVARFEGDVLPSQNDPVFQREIGTQPNEQFFIEEIKNGIFDLTITQAAPPGDTFAAYSLNTLSLDPQKGYSMEVRARVKDNSQWGFNSRDLAGQTIGVSIFRISQSGINRAFFFGGSTVRLDDLNLTQFHTYLVKVSQNQVNYFMDGALVSQTTPVSFNVSPFRFFAQKSVMTIAGGIEIDYIRINTAGSEAPLPPDTVKPVLEAAIETPFIEVPEIQNINHFAAFQDVGEGEIVHEFSTDGNTFLSVGRLAEADLSAKKIKFRSTLKRVSGEKKSPSLDALAFELKRDVLVSTSAAGLASPVFISFIVSERLISSPTVTIDGGQAFDGNAPPSLSWKFRFQAKEDNPPGLHPIVISGNDLAGNFGIDDTGRLTIDSFAPQVNNISPRGGDVFVAEVSTINVNVSIQDNLDPKPAAAIKLFQVQNKGLLRGPTVFFAKDDDQISPRALDDGSWNMEVEGRDWVANSTKVLSGIFEVVHDTLTPRSNLAIGTPAFIAASPNDLKLSRLDSAAVSFPLTFVRSETLLTLNSIDDALRPLDQKGVGVLSHSVSLNGLFNRLFQNPNPQEGQVFVSSFTLSDILDGVFQLSFLARDALDQAESTQTIAVALDNTAPFTEFAGSRPLFKENNTVYATSRDTFGFVTRDNLSGVKETLFRIDAAPFESFNPSNPLTFPQEGRVEITFKSRDQLGNEEAERTVALIIDNTPPTFSGVNAVTIQAEDPLNTIVKLETFDGALRLPTQVSAATGEETWTFRWEGDRLASQTSPPFSVSRFIFGSGTIDESLEQDNYVVNFSFVPGGSFRILQLKQNDAGMSFAVGHTAAWRVKVAPSVPFLLAYRDGNYNHRISITAGDVSLSFEGEIPEIIAHVPNVTIEVGRFSSFARLGLDAAIFHDYRVTSKVGQISFYIDGKLIVEGRAQSLGSIAGRALEMQIGNGSEKGRVELDYFRVNNQGVFPPPVQLVGELEGTVETPFINLPEINAVNGFKTIQSVNEGDITHEFSTDGTVFKPVVQLSEANISAGRIKFRSTIKRASLDKTSPMLDAVSFDLKRHVMVSTAVAGPQGGIARITFITSEQLQSPPTVTVAGFPAFDGNNPPSFLWNFRFTPDSAMVDGSHSIHIVGADLAGNTGEDNTGRLNIDTKAPQIVIASPVGGERFLATIHTIPISVNIQDNLDTNPRITRLELVQRENTGLLQGPTVFAVASGQFLEPGSLDDGRWVLEAEGKDWVENSTRIASGIFEILHDTQPPRSLLSMGEPRFGAGDVDFVSLQTMLALSSTDDRFQVFDSTGLGVARQRLALDDVLARKFINPAPRPGEAFQSEFSLAGAPDGVYSLRFSAVDQGGIEESSQTVKIALDSEAPKTTLAASRPLFRENGTFYATSRDTFGFVATDNLSGVRQTLFSIDDGTLNSFDPTLPISFSSEGRFVLRFKSIDQVANEEAMQTVTIVIDNTSPSFSGAQAVRLEAEDSKNVVDGLESANGSLRLITRVIAADTPDDFWTIRYEGDVLPKNNQPPMNVLLQTGRIGESLENGIYSLLINDPFVHSDDTNELSWFNIGLDEIAGFTVEIRTKLKLVPHPGSSFFETSLFVTGGRSRVNLILKPNQACFRIGNTFPCVPVDVREFHVYRIVLKEGQVALYVDGSKALEGPARLGSQTTSKLLLNLFAFNAKDNGLEIDYLRMNPTTPLDPTPKLEGNLAGSVETSFVFLPEVTKINGFKAFEDVKEGEILHEFSMDSLTFLPVAQLSQADITSGKIKFRSTLKRSSLEQASPLLDGVSFELKREVLVSTAVVGPKRPLADIFFIGSERVISSPTVTIGGSPAFDGNLPPSMSWKFRFTAKEESVSGLHPVVIEGLDLAGNVGEDQTGRLTVDTLPPVIQFVSPRAGEKFAATVSSVAIQVTLNDNLDPSPQLAQDILLRQVANKGLKQGATVFVAANGTGIDPFVLDDGLWVAEASAQDWVFNSTFATSGVFEVVHDTLAPRSMVEVGEPKVAKDDLVFVSKRSRNFLTSIDDLVKVGDARGFGVALQKFSLNGRAPKEFINPNPVSGSLFSNPIALEEEADGVKLISFTASDLVSNLEEEKSKKLALDNTPPMTKLEVSTPAVTVDSITVVSAITPIEFLADDPVINQVAVGIGSTSFRVVLATETTPEEIPLALFSAGFTLAEGRYAIQFKSTDLLENEEPINKAEILSDGRPPAITITSPKEGDKFIATISSIPINVIVTDNLDPNPRFTRLELTELENRGLLRGATSLIVHSGEFIDPFSIDDGLWVLKAQAKDWVDNSTKVVSGVFEVIHDIQPPRTAIKMGDPKVEVTTAIPGTTPADPGLIFFTKNTPLVLDSIDDLISVGDEIGLGVALQKLLVNGVERSTFVNPNPGQGATFISSFTLAADEDGLYTLGFFADDIIGNREGIKIATVAVDNTTPQTVIAIGTPTFVLDSVRFINAGTLIGFNADDPLVNSVAVGVSTTEFRVDGAPFGVFASSFTLSEGIRTVDFKSTDRLGNEEAIKTQRLHVDATPPITSLRASAPFFENGFGGSFPDQVPGIKQYALPGFLYQLPSVDPVAEEVASGVLVTRYRSVPLGAPLGSLIEPSAQEKAAIDFIAVDPLDPNAPFGTGFSFGLAEGIHRVEFKSFDNVLNLEVLKGVTVYVDATPPQSQLIISSPCVRSDGTVISSKTPLTINANDPIVKDLASGLAKSFFKDFNNADFLSRDTRSNTETPFFVSASTPDGFVDVRFYSVDNVGNNEQVKSKTVVLDNTPPIIEFISPVTSTENPGLCKLVGGDQIRVIGTVKDKGTHLNNQIFDHFESYRVEFGLGSDPVSFTTIIDTVTQVSLENAVLASWDTSSLPEGVYTLKITAKDCVGNESEQRVQVIVSKPKLLLSLGRHGQGLGEFNQPSYIAVDPRNGDFWVSDQNNDRIQKFNSSGTFLLAIGPSPYQITIGTSSNSPQLFDNSAGITVSNSADSASASTALGYQTLSHNPNHNPPGQENNTNSNAGGNDNGNGQANSNAGGNSNGNSQTNNGNAGENGNANGQGNANSNSGGNGNTQGGGNNLAGNMNKPTGVAVEASGDLYAADRNKDRVLVFSSTGSIIRELSGNPYNFNKPHGLALDSQGNLYVADRNNDRIVKISTTTGEILQAVTTAIEQDFNKPQGVLAVDSQSQLYITDRNNDRVLIFSSTGGFKRQLGNGSGLSAGQFNKPDGIAINGKGFVYVSDQNNSRIQKFDPQGNPLLVFSVPKNDPESLNHPGGLAVTKEGDLLVADSNNAKVKKFGVEGELVVIASQGESDPSRSGLTKDGSLTTKVSKTVTKTSGGIVVHPQGAKVEIPANAVGSETITITVEPKTKAPSAKVSIAGNAAPAASDSSSGPYYQIIGQAIEFQPEGTTFNQPVTLTLPYNADELAGAKESDLIVAYYNPQTQQWEPLSGIAIDTGLKLAKAQTNHFSLYAVLAPMVPSNSAFAWGEVFVFPNPARGGKKPVFHIEAGIADEIAIRVYDMSGEQVVETAIGGVPQVVDRGGAGPKYAYEYTLDQDLPSDVYLYVIQARRNGQTLKKTGSFSVVR